VHECAGAERYMLLTRAAHGRAGQVNDDSLNSPPPVRTFTWTGRERGPVESMARTREKKIANAAGEENVRQSPRLHMSWEEAMAHIVAEVERRKSLRAVALAWNIPRTSMMR